MWLAAFEAPAAASAGWPRRWRQLLRPLLLLLLVKQLNVSGIPFTNAQGGSACAGASTSSSSSAAGAAAAGAAAAGAAAAGAAAAGAVAAGAAAAAAAAGVGAGAVAAGVVAAGMVAAGRRHQSFRRHARSRSHSVSTNPILPRDDCPPTRKRNPPRGGAPTGSGSRAVRPRGQPIQDLDDGERTGRNAACMCCASACRRVKL